MNRGDGIEKALEYFRKCPGKPGLSFSEVCSGCPLHASVIEGMEHPTYCDWLCNIEDDFG